MLILGVETSCDETSAAVVADGRSVLANVTQSSVREFRDLGGIVPEQAARRQLECMLPVLEGCFRKARKTWNDVHAIAVTKGPGLIGSLLVGTTTTRVLARVLGKPLIGVHHTLGHLHSTWLRPQETEETDETEEDHSSDSSDSSDASASSPQFPLLTLSVSGGHTELWYRTDVLKGKLLGQTLDDAAGEAFDKGAVLLGLGFPGGPALSKLAEGGDPKAYDFPLPLAREPGFDFSFSGLKTALKYLLRDLSKSEARSTKHETSTNDQNQNDPCHFECHVSDVSRISNFEFRISDVAASYQEALCAHLLDRVRRALRQFTDVKEVHLVGGVAANIRLRIMLQELLHNRTDTAGVTMPALPKLSKSEGGRIPAPRSVSSRGAPSSSRRVSRDEGRGVSKGLILFRTPTRIDYCTDNAAMIAGAAYVLWKELGDKAFTDFATSPSVVLTEIRDKD